MPEICSIDGCGKTHLARGWCRTHYLRWRRSGDPLGRSAPDHDAWWWHKPSRLKTCIRCGEGKPVSEFYAYEYTTRQGKRKTRYESRCKPCAQERRRETVRANPERYADESRSWREKNVERMQRYNAERQRRPEVKAQKAYHQRLRKARMRAQAGDNAEIRAIYAEAMRIEQIVACCPVFDLPELGKKIHVDHIRALARGGKHEAGNLQILPIGINMRKGTKCPR